MIRILFLKKCQQNSDKGYERFLLCYETDNYKLN
jgi:hypothetical protein